MDSKKRIKTLDTYDVRILKQNLVGFKFIEIEQIFKNLSRHNKKVNLGKISCGPKLGPFSEESTLILNGI